MRSRKEEYAKKFEDLTKQEIKNYNDTLLATNKALQDFRNKLTGLADSYSSQVAILSSNMKKLEVANSFLQEENISMTYEMKSLRSDFNKLKELILEKEKIKCKEIEFLKDSISKTIGKISFIESKNTENDFEIRKIDNNLRSEIKTTYDRTKNENAVLKNEILNLPSEAEQIKIELLDKIKVSEIDNAGISKELKFMIKEIIKQKKMNEYFHEQIHRLKIT